MGYYDTAQICLKGHVVNDRFHGSPAFNQQFCNKCGAKTIIACPRCQTEVRGDYHAEGVVIISGRTMKAPEFCHACGKAYPWVSSLSQVLHRLSFTKARTKKQDRPRAADNETAYDRFQRRLKEHPLGIVMLVAVAVIGFLGWDNVTRVYGWFLPEPECRYFVIEPFVRLEDGSDPDQLPRTREVNVLVEHSATTRRTAEFTRLNVVTLKSFDVGDYDFGISVGNSQTQTVPGRSKGFYASHLWRTTAHLTKASHYFLTVSPHFVDPLARGGPIGDITIRPMGFWEQQRYSSYNYLQFPPCSDVTSDVK